MRTDLATLPVTVEAMPHPFSHDRITGLIYEGWTIDEIVGDLVEKGELHPALITSTRVFVGDVLVPFSAWRQVRPKAGAYVAVKVVAQGGGGGGGGKSPLKLIAGLAVMALSFYVGAALGPALGAMMGSGEAFAVGATSVTFAQIGTAIVGGVVSMVGNSLINALIPTPTASQDSGNFVSSPLSPPTFATTGSQNKGNPYGPIPRVYGRKHVFPVIAAMPYTEVQGSDQYLRMVFTAGYGPLLIEDILIGNTPITAFTGVQYETRQGYATDAPLTLYTQSVKEDTLSILLTVAGGAMLRTSHVDATELSIDVTFQRGLTHFNTNGGRDQISCDVLIEYSPAGANTWTTATTLTTTDNSTSAVRNTYQWNVTSGQYDVRLTRATADQTDAAYVDLVTWTALRSVTPEHPVVMTGLSLIAVYIKASDQLNGVIQQLSCVATSLLPIWDGTSWSAPTATRNPAWAFCDVLKGTANSLAVTDARLDLPTLLTWAQACDAASPQADGAMFTFDVCFDALSTVFETLRQITSAGRAAFVMKDGKFSVVQDIAQTVPRQHFTPRNSWGFRSTKTFIIQPHGTRCHWINPDQGWQQDEIVVYSDGYDATNATLFEALDMLYCTRSGMAWREGRYHMAAALLRPEVYELSVDAEALVCVPGDLVMVSHDVPQWGAGWGRITAMEFDNAENVTSLTVDETLIIAAGKSYSVRIRKADGTSILNAVTAAVGETDTLTLSPSIVAGTGPNYGDMVMFGETTRESAPLIIRSIAPINDLAVTLKLVDASPAVHDWYSGPMPPFQTNLTTVQLPAFTPPPQPVFADIRDTVVRVNGAIVEKTTVTLGPIAQSTVAAEAVQLQWQVPGAPSWQAISGTPGQLVFPIFELVTGQIYNFRARSISQYGTASAWATATFTPLGLNANPLDVTGFSIQMLGAVAQLSWDQTEEADIDHALIRFAPVASGASWESMPSIGPNGGAVAWPATSVQLPTMAGTYAIKWVDTGGRMSVNPQMIETTVPGLGYLGVATVTESPGFSGTKTGCSVTSGELRLTDPNGTPTGTYAFAAPYDLGAVYTTRITAAVSGYGYSTGNNVDSWPNVEMVVSWDGTPQTGWGTLLEISTTPDNPSGSPTWGPWQAFAAGDYTARGFRWRLTLTSTAIDVSPSITGLSIAITAPNRTESAANIVSGAGGTAIVYASAFYDNPAVGVSGHAMATGDYFTITAKYSTGFTVQFFNASGTGISRTFDWLASGHGTAS